MVNWFVYLVLSLSTFTHCNKQLFTLNLKSDQQIFIYLFSLNRCGSLILARNGFRAFEPGGFLEAACCLCQSLFYCEEQRCTALRERLELSGRDIQTSAQTCDSHQTHEDRLWPENNGMMTSCGELTLHRISACTVNPLFVFLMTNVCPFIICLPSCLLLFRLLHSSLCGCWNEEEE